MPTKKEARMCKVFITSAEIAAAFAGSAGARALKLERQRVDERSAYPIKVDSDVRRTRRGRK